MRHILLLFAFFSFALNAVAAEVIPRVITVSIMPDKATAIVGQSVDFIATASYDNGEQVEFIDGFVSDGGTFDYGTFVPSGTGTFIISNSLDGKTGTAAVVVIGTQTITEPVEMKPYIVRVDISPTDAVINAGDSMSFFATAYYNTGKTIEVISGFVCDLGTFSGSSYSSFVAGRANITLDCNGVTGQASVSVLPAPPHKLTIDMADTFDYGSAYPTAKLLDYSLYDKYDNPIDMNKKKATHHIQKNTLGILGQQLGSGVATNPILKALAPIIKTGYIADGDNILFFERGSYTVTAKYGDIVGTKIITIDFSQPYQGVTAWADYRISKIDFDRSIIDVAYSVMPANIERIQVPEHLMDKFYEGSFIDKFQVICWGHYLILQRRAEVIKEANRQQMNGLLKLLLKDGIVK